MCLALGGHAGRVARVVCAALFLSVLAGCPRAPVRIEYDTNEHLTTSTGDRLYRARANRIGAIYLRPGVRFADYGTVAFQPVTVDYESPPRVPSVLDRRVPGNYALSPEALARLERLLREGLARELNRDEVVQVVVEPASDTMMISPHIYNLRWEVPPVLGSESMYVRRAGVMTLILDLRDARTGELLARLADSHSIKPFGVSPRASFENTPANTQTGVRDVCERWSWLLAESLLTLRELPPMPLPTP